MSSTHRRRVGLIVAGLLLWSACSTNSGTAPPRSSTATPSPSVVETLPVGATEQSTVDVATTATTVSATAPVSTTGTTAQPVVELEFVDGPCRFVTSAGVATITLVVADRLWELSADRSTATCLEDLHDEPVDDLRWSPGADRVLLSADRVLDGAGARDTGYLASNSHVQWSFPTGRALIAPAVKDGALLWRSATDSSDRIDISFLDRTDVAVYHPAGKNIFAAGVSADGGVGLFVASNRGANTRAIAALDDPTTSITEIVADAGGSQVYFIHDRGTDAQVHLLELPSLILTDVATFDEAISELTSSVAQFGGVSFRVGDCSGSTRTVAWQYGAAIDVGSLSPLAALSTTPIGWLDTSHLVVAARQGGCDGPVDVWVADLVGQATLVATSVEQVAVRSAVASFGELPDDINARAPG